DLELAQQDLADLAHSRLGERCLLAQGLGQRGLHVAHREPAYEAGDHQRLQRLGPGHPEAEQAGDEGLVVPPQLGPLDRDRAGRGLDRDRRVPVAQPVLDPPAPGVAFSPKELGHLRFAGGREEERDPEPCHLLQDLAELPPGTEELVKLLTEALTGGYSFRRWHLSPPRTARFKASLLLASLLHQLPAATHSGRVSCYFPATPNATLRKGAGGEIGRAHVLNSSHGSIS